MKEEKQLDKKLILPIILMGGLFVLIHGLSLFLMNPFISAGIQPAFENPDDPFNIIYILVIMLAFTAVILLIAKFFKKYLIQIIILIAIGYTSFYAFFLPIFTIIMPDFIFEIILTISLLTSIVLIFVLYKHPEWYIIDITGVVVGVAAIIVFGISLGVLIVILLLVALSVYDAISVYKTKHMIDLADTVMDLKLPVLLVVPKIRHYSLIKETKSLKEKLKEDEERDAFFMGLGDIVMPGMLVAAVFYSGVEQNLLLAISTIIGTLAGFVILMSFVIKGKPQAGLPCLCGGAIAGYIVSSLVLCGRLVGVTLPTI